MKSNLAELNNNKLQKDVNGQAATKEMQTDVKKLEDE